MDVTKILEVGTDVSNRLKELRLTRVGLLAVAAQAVSAAAAVTANHPNNSAGTYRYHEGTAGLRDTFAGNDGWEKDCANNIEAIVNREIGVKVVFQNVEHACSMFHDPQPSSPKRSASVQCILTNSLFHPSEIPQTFDPSRRTGIKTYYLMVSERSDNVDVELSLVIGINASGQFDGFAERIFLSFPDWYSPNDPHQIGSEDGDDDYPFEISRK